MAETVCILNPKVDKIIANVKNIFKKIFTSRVQIFKDIVSLLPLPPELVLMRWCPWLKTALYYCEYFEIVKSTVNSFNKDDEISIETTQKYNK